MSNDSRLGVNPLSWVDSTTQGKDAGTAIPAAASAPLEAARKNNERKDLARIFGPASQTAEEQLMSEGKIKIKQVMDTEQVAQHLKDLAATLESRTMRAEGGEKTLVLSIPDTIKMEMKVSRKKEKGKLALELEWKDEGAKSEALKISDE